MLKNVSGAKNYNASFLYGQVNYGPQLLEAILKGERIEKKGEKFKEVVFHTKRRQTTSVLVDIMMSDNIVLLHPLKPLPQSFNVFCMKDVKTDSKLKVFIDCTTTIKEVDGFYTSKNIDIFIAQLVAAGTNLIYYADPNRIITNSRLTLSGTKCFSSLFCYILDYLRISGFQNNKDRVKYLSALYYQCGILWKDLNDTSRQVARKVADIDQRHADIAEMFMKGKPEEVFININNFIEFISSAFKLTGLTTEGFVDKFIFLMGTGNQFALEVFPAFSKLITDAYSGTYINRQRTIEKIIPKDMVTYTTDLFDIMIAAKGKKV